VSLEPPGRLDGKAAVVTGGASGLGRATATALARAGVQVLVADVDEEMGAETVAIVEDAGSAGLFVATDVTRPEAVEAMVAACVAAFGSLDFAVNNAGTTGKGGFVADYDLDDWHRTVAINLDGVFYALRAELPVMVGQGKGSIVNVASGAGLVGFAGLPAYVASKHGVVGLTRAAAIEYAKQGVRVNCVCPGSTRTPMLEGFMGDDPRIEKMMVAGVPLGRLGRPEEIAEAIVWLLSDAASFVIGHALAVDGGSVVQ
jgi:NAD(P)-dependent dehydrogenase (short-subunit alcohol dehydrogenase family)